MKIIKIILWVFKSIKTTSLNLLFYQSIHKRDYIIFEKEKLIYIPIPKCAHTTMKECLKGLVGKDTASKSLQVHTDIRFPVCHKLTNEHLNGSYIIFIIVRDPLERIVSGYFNRVEEPLRLNKSQNNEITSTLNYLFGYFRKDTETLEKFLKKLVKIPTFLMETHFRPMSDFFKIKNISNIKVIDMSKLEAQFEPIRKKFNLPILEIKNKTEQKKTDAIKKLPEDLVNKIRFLYRKDYKLYKKSFYS